MSFAFPMIGAQNLPTYTGSIGSHTSLVAVIDNARTVRIPWNIVAQNYVTFTPVPGSPAAEGMNGQMATDSQGTYTYTSNNGWGKIPRYTQYWDDLTSDVRFLKVDSVMNLTSSEKDNVYTTLDLHIATDDAAGLVKGGTSSQVTYTIDANDNFVLDNPVTDTGSWYAGVKVAEDGTMTLSYATATEPGVVLLGGDNPLAAATIGNINAVKEWVTEYVDGVGKHLADSYEGGTITDPTTLKAGTIKADYVGNTIYIDDDGRAYVPVGTSANAGSVFVEYAQDEDSTYPVVYTKEAANDYITQQIEERFDESPISPSAGVTGKAGAVIPQGGITLRNQTIDVRAATPTLYGGVYVITAVDGIYTPQEVDANNTAYQAVPTVQCMTDYVDVKLSSSGDLGEAIEQVLPTVYGTTNTTGTIRLGENLEVTPTSTSGTMSTRVKAATTSTSGAVVVADTITAPDTTSEYPVVPTTSAVRSFINDSEANVYSTVSTDYAADDTYLQDTVDDEINTTLRRLVYEDIVAYASISDSITASEVYLMVGQEYLADSTIGASLRGYVTEDIQSALAEYSSQTLSDAEIADAIYREYSTQSISASGTLRNSIYNDIITYGGGSGTELDFNSLASVLRNAVSAYDTNPYSEAAASSIVRLTNAKPLASGNANSPYAYTGTGTILQFYTGSSYSDSTASCMADNAAYLLNAAGGSIYSGALENVITLYKQKCTSSYPIQRFKVCIREAEYFASSFYSASSYAPSMVTTARVLQTYSSMQFEYTTNIDSTAYFNADIDCTVTFYSSVRGGFAYHLTLGMDVYSSAR